ncbi:hypothetical protein GTP91_25980 [Rugamonas sp. FT82W]|uniref:Uncharacterized protein n=1 Tax=Duganella vulcania TaxID=2692166 RepID=A0A845GCT6_9BURK|nr:hypothetical protein [Duganella vulcania]MYM90609.1 hypothetical protein [Duganella vulcania]
MRLRENTRLANAIQQAIIIDATVGAAHAWAYLSALDVPQSTILRVLSGTGQRRASDRRPASQMTTE